MTPSRLMRHLMERTRDLDPRFRDIARYYKLHGEALRIRWDYAFYQMLLETNYLSYKTGSGRWGDVDPRQNNFAGIGTTGGGVPGDSFPDVSTGVLAQMQHLIAYSGERVAKPLAPRTREKQDDIIELSLALRRPVRFDDLTNRWAKDRNYAKSIEWVAERYRQANCTADRRAAEARGGRRSPPSARALARPCASRARRPIALRHAAGACLRCARGQLRRLGRPADPLGGRRHGQLHGSASRREPRAAAGRRFHQDAHAQRQDDRALHLARERVGACVRALPGAVLRAVPARGNGHARV